jgi:hypothetical protein
MLRAARCIAHIEIFGVAFACTDAIATGRAIENFVAPKLDLQ